MDEFGVRFPVPRVPRETDSFTREPVPGKDGVLVYHGNRFRQSLFDGPPERSVFFELHRRRRTVSSKVAIPATATGTRGAPKQLIKITAARRKLPAHRASSRLGVNAAMGSPSRAAGLEDAWVVLPRSQGLKVRPEIALFVQRVLFFQHLLNHPPLRQ